jgi:hypothetical protein
MDGWMDFLKLGCVEGIKINRFRKISFVEGIKINRSRKISF